MASSSKNTHRVIYKDRVGKDAIWSEHRSIEAARREAAKSTRFIKGPMGGSDIEVKAVKASKCKPAANS